MARTKSTTTTKKPVITSSVIQFQGIEFDQDTCLKKAKDGFKKQYKDVELEDLKIYIKPEERMIYYVANNDRVGSVEL